MGNSQNVDKEYKTRPWTCDKNYIHGKLCFQIDTIVAKLATLHLLSEVRKSQEDLYQMILLHMWTDFDLVPFVTVLKNV